MVGNDDDDDHGRDWGADDAHPPPPGFVHADLPAAGAAERSEEPPRHCGRPVPTGHPVCPAESRHAAEQQHRHPHHSVCHRRHLAGPPGRQLQRNEVCA